MEFQKVMLFMQSYKNFYWVDAKTLAISYHIQTCNANNLLQACRGVTMGGQGGHNSPGTKKS